jgi:hypothetical protein
MCRDVAYWHIRVGSLRRTDSVAIEGIADIGEALLPVGATRMTQLRHGGPILLQRKSIVRRFAKA